MEVAYIYGLVLFAAMGISGLWFYLGRELPLIRRLLASSHALLAATILPILFVLHQLGVYEVPDGRAAGIMLVLSVLSFSSILYSTTVLPHLRTINVLHLVTLAVLWGSTAIGALMTMGT